MTICLIDADVLTYQCAFAGQFKDEQSGELVMKDFDAVEEMLTLKIREITEECMSDEEPLLFLTGDATLANHLNRRPKWVEPLEKIELRPSFRYEEATTKVYKGTRKADKPLHYDNIRAYMLAVYNCVVSDKLEADDMLAIYQTTANGYNDPAIADTIICSVDKDLRQVPGKHYSWSIGSRPGKPVYEVDEFGTMELAGKPKKLSATGLRSLFAQALMGDTVDNIQGIEGMGPVKAYEILCESITEMELFLATARAYRDKYPENWQEKLRESLDLVYMIREVDSDGNAIRYKYPEGWELLLDHKAL